MMGYALRQEDRRGTRARRLRPALLSKERMLTVGEYGMPAVDGAENRAAVIASH